MRSITGSARQRASSPYVQTGWSLAVVARLGCRIAALDPRAIAQAGDASGEPLFDDRLRRPGGGGKEVVELERIGLKVVVLDLFVRLAWPTVRSGWCDSAILDVDLVAGPESLEVAWRVRRPWGAVQLERDGTVARPFLAMSADRAEQ